MSPEGPVVRQIVQVPARNIEALYVRGEPEPDDGSQAVPDLKLRLVFRNLGLWRIGFLLGLD